MRIICSHSTNLSLKLLLKSQAMFAPDLCLFRLSTVSATTINSGRSRIYISSSCFELSEKNSITACRFNLLIMPLWRNFFST